MSSKKKFTSYEISSPHAKQDHSQMPFRIPVAIRKQYGKKGWTSIMATRDDRLSAETCFIAGNSVQRPRITWTSIKFAILSLQKTILWNIFIIMCITVNFFSVTSIVFTTQDAGSNVLYICLFCDLIFLFNWCLSMTIYNWKEVQIRTGVKPKSFIRLVIDGILCSALLLTVICLFKSITIIWEMNYIAVLQIYYLPIYFIEQSQDIGVNRWVNLLVPYILYLTIFVHTVGVVLYAIAKNEISSPQGCWFHTLEQYRKNENPTAIDMYIYSVHFSVMLVTGLGLGDVTAVTVIELAVTSFVMIAGFCFAVLYFIGTLSSVMVNDAERLELYRADLIAIRDYLTDINCEEKVKNKVIRYYIELWHYKKGIKRVPSIDLLPISLRMELFHDMCMGPFKSTLLFRFLPDYFLRKLSMSMKPVFYLPGDILSHQHVAKYMMIIILSGVVHILSDEDNESPIISFDYGTCISEIGMVYTLPAKSSIRAATYLEVLTLHKLDFFRAVKEYPEIQKRIRLNIQDRIERAHKKDIYRPKKKNIFNLFVTQETEITAIKQIKKLLKAKPVSDFNTLLKAHDNELTLKYILGLYNIYQSDTIIPEKDLICIPNPSYPFIINPRTKLDSLWRTIVFCTILLLSIVYPYYVAFDRSYPNWFQVYLALTDIIYYIDIYVLLTTAIIHKNKNVITFKAIYHYRLNRLPFYLDFISVMPIEQFSSFIEDYRHNYQIYYYLKFNRFVKVWKMWKYFTDMENNFFGRIFIIRICKYTLFLLLLSYWMGVILYIESCFALPCRKTSWYVQQQIMEVTNHMGVSFVKHKEIMSIYFGFSTVSGAGYGDLYPTDIIDTIFIWIARLLGIILFNYCISDLSEFITFRFQLQSAFKERFNMLLRYVSQSDVTNAVKNRLLACYVLQWYHSGGFRTAQKHQLLQKAVSFMRQDVLAAERKKTLKKVPLFSSTNDDFIATLASGSRMDTLPPGEYVVYAGLVNRQLYIIHQGYCEIIENNTAIRTLHPGAHFCVECLLYGHPSILTVRTLTHCKILSISSYIFFKATDMFPKYLEHEQLSFDNILAKTYKTYKKESQVLSKAKIVNSNIMRIKNLFANSLINVKKYCRRRHENYNKGFEGDNNIFKYILLPICITPQGLLLKIWCFFRILAAFCIAMLLPFDITITPYTNNFVNLIIIVSDAIAYIDLYVSMFIGYYGKQGQLIIHPMKTAKRYVSTLFILDIILCIPINKINRALPLDDYKEVEWWLNMIRLIRIGQVYRIHGAMSYLLSDILKSDRIYIIIEFIVITLVASNIWSCIFVNTTCQPYLKRADEIHMKCLEGSWHVRSVFANQTEALEVYLTAFYWTSSQIIGYGFGDITPHKPVHIMHCILSILVGQLLIAFACAYIASSISTQHRTLVTFQEKLCNITSFMKRQNVSPDLRKLIHKHFLQRYKRTGGIEPMEVLNDIHTTLMEDAVHSMFEETLQIVPLFSFVEKSFFRIIALHLANRHYVKGEEIVRCNYITRNIYILHRGKVQVKNSNDEPICIIGPGAIFGRINALASKPSSVTIEALHNLDVLVIEYDIFYNILKDYPKIMHKIHNELKKDVDYILPKVIIDDDATRVSLCSKFTTNTDITGSTQVTLNTVVTMESMPKWNVVLNPRKCFRIALIPDSILCQIHSALVLIASYASTILITYQFFFHDLSLIYILPSICIDLVFILKILLDLQMAYVNKLGDYVLDVKLIRMRYLTDYKERLIDVAANLPLCYFALLVPGPFGLDLFVYLRLHHLIRIVYIIQFYNVHSRMLSSASFLLKLSWLLVWFTLLMHIFACFWFYIPCMGSKCKRGFWGEERGLAKEEHPFANYVHSLYHMTNIMTMTGHGDIKPMIPVELLLSVMFVVTTKIFVGTLIGEISYVQNLYSLEQVNYTRTVVELKHYMTNNNLSAVKQKKMWNYVRRLWIKDKGRQMPSLYNDLPLCLKCDLMYEMYGIHIQNSYVFEKCSMDFIKQLCAHLNRYIFYPTNYVVQSGDADLCMYFIHLGEIEVLTIHQDMSETIHDVLGTWDTFGVVQGLYSGIPHYFSFRAKTEVEIVYLCYNNWKHFQQFFPDVVATIYERAEKILSYKV